jgi:hypothetical protein
MVDFASAVMEEVDPCVTVSDDHVGALGTVCATGSPAVFEYTIAVGPYETCGDVTFTNVASFIAEDTGTTGSADWTIPISVPCAGCTLTPGYWKTHSSYGPAPYDETWALLPQGADTTFFLSGASYYQALWTPPAGNVYYVLARAYIAAELNGLNGASLAPVQPAFVAAAGILATDTPAYVATLRGRGGLAHRGEILQLAAILDDFNNGLVGPGHCDE